jgi:hypothetical protein
MKSESFKSHFFIFVLLDIPRKEAIFSVSGHGGSRFSIFRLSAHEYELPGISRIHWPST